MKARFRSPFLRLTIRAQLMLLTLVFLGGILLFSGVAHDTLTTTRIHGPYYNRIAQGKDLVADILPPPAYIVEAKLLVLQILETDELEQISSLILSFDRLEREFIDRHKFWAANLPEGEMKELMCVQSFEFARRFFVIARRDFFPLILSENHAEAEVVVKGILRDCFQQHRACVDKVVEIAKARIAKDEQESKVVIAQRTKTLVGFGMILVVLVTFGSEMLGKRIATRLDETVRVLKAVAAGDLTQQLQTRGHDEIAQMGVALNRAIAARVDIWPRSRRPMRRSRR